MNILKKIWQKIPLGIQFNLKLYISTMAIFTMFRIVFLCVGYSQVRSATFLEILESFRNGLMYDSSTAGYLLIIPFLMSMFAEMIPIKSFKYKKVFLYIITIIYFLAFSVMSADIPYFMYFNTRLTSSVFNWFTSPKIVFGFLLESSEYYIYTFLVLILCYGFYRLVKYYINTWQRKQDALPDSNKTYRVKLGLLFLLLAVFQFAAIRGKITTRRPLSFGEAFSTTNHFLNYMGLNPLFTLGNTYFTNADRDVMGLKLMDEHLAIENVRRYLSLTEQKYDSPLARECKFDSTTKHNVVVIIMESMGDCFLGRSGFYKPSLTPFLDNIISKSVLFSNFYSDGIHTHNGIWSSFTSLFSSPSEANAMMDIQNMQTFSGIGSTLLNNGYSTFFGCPHDANFDNMGGMLSMNGFQKVLSAGEFLNKDFVNVWGTSDHLLFNNCIPYIKNLGNAGKPFLAAMMTISNHGPYQLPNPLPAGFRPKQSSARERAVEYADWSLKYFLDNVKNEPWFDNTIFVFMADHGQNLYPNYEINYYYKHIPLIIYAPNIIKEAKVIDNLGCQADMFPTVMQLLGINYVNNTMGVNLFKDKRKFVPHALHSTVSAISDSLMLIRRNDGNKQLYKYRNLDPKDYSSEFPQIAKEMEEYVLSNMQASMYLVKSKKGKFTALKK